MPKKSKWTGRKIRLFRESLGITQEQFGKLIGCSTRHYVSQLEKTGVWDDSVKRDILDLATTVKDRVIAYYTFREKQPARDLIWFMDAKRNFPEI